MADQKTPEQRLEEASKELGLSRQELAHGLQVSLSTIAMIFAGHHKLRPTLALAVEAVYGINKDWIMSGKGSKLTANSIYSQDAMKLAALYDNIPSKSGKRAAMRCVQALERDGTAD